MIFYILIIILFCKKTFLIKIFSLKYSVSNVIIDLHLQFILNDFFFDLSVLICFNTSRNLTYLSCQIAIYLQKNVRGVKIDNISKIVIKTWTKDENLKKRSIQF